MSEACAAFPCLLSLGDGPGELTLGGFSSASGLAPSTPTPLLTLRRGIVDLAALRQWPQAPSPADAAAEPPVVLILRGEAGQPLARFRLLRARLAGVPDAPGWPGTRDAAGPGGAGGPRWTAMEELLIACDRVLRVPD